MNYRHAFHAGNFADVVKHAILARLIDYLKRKDKAFRVFDTHAGPGLYDLMSDEAQRTSEWRDGIAKLQAATPKPEIAALLAPYLEAVAAQPEGHYPGSPAIARHLMRKQDRLSLYELHKEDFAALSKRFGGDFQTKLFNLDGYLAPAAHVPPKEARGLMLIDPPFEVGDDFDRMIEAATTVHKRFAGGVIALWYPVKKRSHTDDWLETISRLGFPEVLNIEVTVRAPDAVGRLNGSGMVIINPPYTLRGELQVLGPWLSDLLKQGKGSDCRIRDLSSRG